MTQLHQFQLTYVPLQDRLLFRINTLEKQEFRFWLTRRYVKLLWQALLEMLKNRHVHHYTDEETRAAVLSFQHQHAVSQADFTTDYQVYETLPLGEQPILVSKVSIKGADDQQRLCLHPQTGMGLELNLNAKMLHSLCRLLSEVTQRAEWDLNLASTMALQPVPKSLLN